MGQVRVRETGVERVPVTFAEGGDDDFDDVAAKLAVFCFFLPPRRPGAAKFKFSSGGSFWTEPTPRPCLLDCRVIICQVLKCLVDGGLSSIDSLLGYQTTMTVKYENSS